MAAGSKTAVYAAIGANSLVTVAKTAGFLLTGSGAMMSEAVHSAADVGNQVLLAIGMKRATLPPDVEHPFGYGQEAFIWALMSAVGMFFLGCGVAVSHGFNSLFSEHHSVEISSIAIGILLFSLVIEGASALIAVRFMVADATKEGVSAWTYLRTTDDPFGVAVLLEDGAAVLGVLIALGAVILTKLTGNPNWDAYGTLAIGGLLGLIALYLIRKNRVYLVGKAISKGDQQALQQVLSSDPAIERVIVQRTVMYGPDHFKVSAELDLNGRYLAGRYLEHHDVATLHAGLSSPEDLRGFLVDYSETLMNLTASEIRRIEARVKQAIPEAKNIALEPSVRKDATPIPTPKPVN